MNSKEQLRKENIRSISGKELKNGDKIRLKDELWMDWTFISYVYTEGVVKEIDGTFFLNERELYLYDIFEIL
jgi:hypothetical protein